MSILRRTIYYGDTGNGVMRFLDWAMVVTTLGQMVEPYVVNSRLSPGSNENLDDQDPNDMFQRVDLIESVDLNKYKTTLSFGSSHALHGGDVLSHVGR